MNSAGINNSIPTRIAKPRLQIESARAISIPDKSREIAISNIPSGEFVSSFVAPKFVPPRSLSEPPLGYSPLYIATPYCTGLCQELQLEQARLQVEVVGLLSLGMLGIASAGMGENLAISSGTNLAFNINRGAAAALIFASCTNTEPIKKCTPVIPEITGLPDTPGHKLVSNYIRESINSLPENFCGIGRIEFVSSNVLSEKLTDEPSSLRHPVYAQQINDANMETLGLGHLISNAVSSPAGVYDESGKVLYLDERIVSDRFDLNGYALSLNDIAHIVMSAHGIAVRTKELVHNMTSDFLTMGESALVSALGATDDAEKDLWDRFPSLVAHYVTSGHFLRAAARRKSEFTTLTPQTESIRTALAFAGYFDRIYAQMKTLFSGREYHAGPYWQELANIDVDHAKAVAEGSSKNVLPRYLPFVMRQVSQQPAGDDVDALAFAGKVVLGPSYSVPYFFDIPDGMAPLEFLQSTLQYLTNAGEKADINLYYTFINLYYFTKDKELSLEIREIIWRITEHLAANFAKIYYRDTSSSSDSGWKLGKAISNRIKFTFTRDVRAYHSALNSNDSASKDFAIYNIRWVQKISEILKSNGIECDLPDKVCDSAGACLSVP